MKQLLVSLLLLCVSTICQAQADPCAANPALFTTCAGYNNILTTGNLVPHPTQTISNGGSLSQTYAINQALGLSGVVVNGFQYGFKYMLGATSTTCTATNQDGSCSWWMTTNNFANVGVSIRDNNNSVLRAFNHANNGSNSGVQERSYVYLLPSTRAPETFGNFVFNAATGGNSSIWGMYSRVMYMPDPCVADPLSSTSCSGYAQAYHDQQCTANPLYATTCTGYQAAYFNQQCTASALYNSGCPGYAVAYHDQQCSISALYMSDCPGYQQAYLTQQCNANQLYSVQCTGYQAAYHNQQCTLNPLYMSDCTGYQTAYFNQQCQLNGLYDKTCPNYTTAYATKMVLDKPATTTTTAVVVPTDTADTSATASALDATVNKVITTPSTTNATSPTSINSVTVTTTVSVQPSSPTSQASTSASVSVQPTAAQQQERATDAKKTDAEVKAAERKSGGDIKAAATARAKELAKASSEATTLEAQTATQGVQVGLMGFVPGFDAYRNALVPDVLGAQVARQYHKPTVDNRSAQRQLSGSNEVRWQQMVDSQYK